MARSSYDPVEAYIGNGSLAAYTFDFKIEALSQLLVVEYTSAGVETQRVRGTDAVYLSSVTFDAEEGGGTVTLAAVLASGRRLKILLANDAPTQPTELRSKSQFVLKNIENALDWLGGAIQRVSYLAQRSVRLSDWTTLADFDPTLPTDITDTPSSVIITNATADGFEMGPTADEIANAQSYAEAAAASAVAADASADSAAASAVSAAASAALIGSAITSLTGDVTTVGSGAAAATIAANAVTTTKILDANVTNAKLADMAQSTFKGRAAGAGTGVPTDLTATQATAILNNVVGDAGAGGTKGLVPAPAAGDAAAGKFLKADGTWALPTGGGGGGGSIKWMEAANSPIASQTNNFEIYNFASGLAQELYTAVRVPVGYIAASQINMRILAYNSNTSGTIRMRAQATLVRAEVDDIASTTNQRTTTNAAITMTASNDDEVQKIVLDLSSSIGEINAVAISAGDLILVRLYRDTDTATGDIKFIPFATEVTFS